MPGFYFKTEGCVSSPKILLPVENDRKYGMVHLSGYGEQVIRQVLFIMMIIIVIRFSGHVKINNA